MSNIQKNEFYTFIITCPENVQHPLAKEISQIFSIALEDVEILFKAVRVKLPAEFFYKIHYSLHCASGIIWEIKSFSAKTPEMVYSQMARIHWSEYFDPTKTYSIEILGDKTNKIEYGNKIRQAIAQSFPANERPKIDLANPQIQLVAFIREGRMSVGIRTSGLSLDKRGHKSKTKEHYAVLKENLASTLVKLANYTGHELFYDPMCGSGTIAIASAYVALKKSPLIHRKDEQFGFMELKNLDRELLRKTQEELRKENTKRPAFPIFASDINPNYVQLMQSVAFKARVEKYINSFERDFFAPKLHYSIQEYINQNPQVRRILLMNTPYFIREDESTDRDPKEFFSLLGKKLKTDYDGWDAYLLVAKSSPWKNVGLKPEIRVELKNGDIDVLFLKFVIYGFKKKEEINGAGYETRTHDLLHGKQTL